jgi:hypothetical protein
MILEVRILQELRAHFSEVRILKDLCLERRLRGARQRTENAQETFELAVEITQRRITYW